MLTISSKCVVSQLMLFYYICFVRIVSDSYKIPLESKTKLALVVHC